MIFLPYLIPQGLNLDDCCSTYDQIERSQAHGPYQDVVNIKEEEEQIQLEKPWNKGEDRERESVESIFWKINCVISEFKDILQHADWNFVHSLQLHF